MKLEVLPTTSDYMTYLGNAFSQYPAKHTNGGKAIYQIPSRFQSHGALIGIVEVD
jgi:hypothetical protein